MLFVQPLTRFSILSLIVCVVSATSDAGDIPGQSGASEATSWFEWRDSTELPPVPDEFGVAGCLVGKLQDVVIVAGGSTFSKPAWEGGEKLFRDRIHVLLPSTTSTDPQWIDGGSLTTPLAHGAVVQTRWGLLCLGGNDGQVATANAFTMQWDKELRRATLDNSWPALPIAADKLSAAAIEGATDTTIYVAGGLNRGGDEIHQAHRLIVPHRSTSAERKELAWEPLPRCPGVARFGAALVTQSNGSSEGLYYLGGKGGGEYLKDAYRFDPSNEKWTRIADLPRPALLAPATAKGFAHIFLFSGSDGHDVDRWQELKDNYHFPKDVLAYHTITDTWTKVGDMPFGVAAATVVDWQGGFLVPDGELRPSVRSKQMLLGKLRLERKSFGVLNFAVMGSYFVLLLGVGFYFTKNESTSEDFFLAGRRIPWWAAGLSLLATQVSSIGFLAIPAKSFATNWTYFAGVLTWFIIVPVVTRVFIPFFRTLNVTSAYEYLELRFNYASRLVAAVAFCCLQLGRMGVVLLLPAIALAAVTGLSTIHCVVIMGVVATIYTVAGGMEAVVWTDVMQAIVLMGGAVVCVAAVVAETPGGWTQLWQVASSDNKLLLANLSFDPTQAVLWVILVGNVLTRFSGLTADQTVVQRYLTTKDEATARRALWLDVAVSIPWAILAFSMGTALYVFYKANPTFLDPTIATDGIVPLFIAQQLPVGVAGLVVAAVFAAAMSSLDSSMHSVATVYVTDIHNRFRSVANSRHQLLLARVTTGLLGVFGTMMATYMASTGAISLWDTFLMLVGTVAGVLAGLFLLGMFTTRTHGVGALLGALVGAIAMYFVKYHTSINLFLYPLVGIGSCFVTGYLASLLIPGKPRVAELTVFTRTNRRQNSTISALSAPNKAGATAG